MKRIVTLLLVLLLLFASAQAEAILPERIISLAPSTTQILDALGLKDELVAVDTNSAMYDEALAGLPQFDMMTPDIEQIAQLEPDVVFTSGMSYIEGDPFAALTDLGIRVVDIPTSESIAAIESDITFIGETVGKEAEAEAIVADMQSTIDAVAAIGSTITEKKTVMFEISALPYLYSFGSGVYLDEMLEIIGAENVFADQSGWLSITEESAVASNPDVILTNVNYIEDSVGEILSREGWSNVTAVAQGDVHYIDNMFSSLPNQKIAKALIEMALAVYPEAFAELAE